LVRQPLAPAFRINPGFPKYSRFSGAAARKTPGGLRSTADELAGLPGAAAIDRMKEKGEAPSRLPLALNVTD
jgi:hypothetical protein